MVGNEIHLPKVIRVEDLETAMIDVDCDVCEYYEDLGVAKFGISRGELYRILEGLPKYVATGLIKDS